MRVLAFFAVASVSALEMTKGRAKASRKKVPTEADMPGVAGDMKFSSGNGDFKMPIGDIKQFAGVFNSGEIWDGKWQPMLKVICQV